MRSPGNSSRRDRKRELIEEHAYTTYDRFLHANEQALRAQPVPPIAREYYSGEDALASFMQQDGRRPRPLHSLYDVFCEVRDDEAAHWATLANLVSGGQGERGGGGG